MKVIDPSESSIKVIKEKNGEPLTVTGVIAGGNLLISAGLFITKLKVSNSYGIKKGNKIKVNPETYEVEKV